MTNLKVVEVKQGIKSGESVALNPIALMSEQEKREIHRRNLGILMIHDPRKIDDLAAKAQARQAEAAKQIDESK